MKCNCQEGEEIRIIEADGIAVRVCLHCQAGEFIPQVTEREIFQFRARVARLAATQHTGQTQR